LLLRFPSQNANAKRFKRIAVGRYPGKPWVPLAMMYLKDPPAMIELDRRRFATHLGFDPMERKREPG